MTDLQATLDAIDELAVHECGHCSKPLADDGPSMDFCSEEHQAAWLGNKRRVEQLIDRDMADFMAGQRAQSRPGGFTTPVDVEAALTERGRPFARERLSYWPEPRPTQRDEAAIERAQTGQWLARLAAPWHPRPMTVRSEYQGRPPQMLLAVRPAPMPIWTMEDPTADSVEFRPDRYQLESVNEHDRSAIYRIQGLPGPRHAVFRTPDWQQVPNWWPQGGWEGRCVEVEGNASGFRWAHPNGDRLIAEPSERYENLPDGVVAEVWEPRPDPAETEAEFRAQMNRRRSLQEAMLRAPAPLDLQAFRRITGV